MVSPSLRHLVQPDQSLTKSANRRVKMLNVEMTPELTPHRLPTSRGDTARRERKGQCWENS
mgnify:CR=1 FL=1